MNVLHTHTGSERARDCINSIGLRWCLFCELKWNRHRNIVCLWDTNICTYFRFHEFHQLFGIRSMCNVPDVYVHIITTYIAKSWIYIIFYCIVKSIPLLPFYERYHARHLSQYSSQNAKANVIYILVLSKLCIQVDEVVLFVYWNGKYVCFVWEWDRTRESWRKSAAFIVFVWYSVIPFQSLSALNEQDEMYQLLLYNWLFTTELQDLTICNNSSSCWLVGLKFSRVVCASRLDLCTQHTYACTHARTHANIHQIKLSTANTWNKFRD